MNKWSAREFTSRKLVTNRRLLDQILNNFEEIGELSEATFAKLILYERLGCWKQEDMFLLAAPIEKFKQYYYGGDFRYQYILSRKPGEIVGEAALMESKPRCYNLNAETPQSVLSIQSDVSQWTKKLLRCSLEKL